MKKSIFMLAAVMAFATAQAQTDKQIKPAGKEQVPATPPTPANIPEGSNDEGGIIDEDGNPPVSPTPYHKDKAQDEHVKSYPDTDRVKDSVAARRNRKMKKS